MMQSDDTKHLFRFAFSMATFIRLAYGQSEVVEINFGHLKKDLSSLVRGTVEETLNCLLDVEADSLCGAKKYERSSDTERDCYRGGSYQRKLHTKAGEVNLKMPKLKEAIFETQIIECYRCRESSVEESIVEMYLAGVSVRHIANKGWSDNRE